jgi:hypothetical protein
MARGALCPFLKVTDWDTFPIKQSLTSQVAPDQTHHSPVCLPDCGDAAAFGASPT